jgi:uncharacterized protein
MDEALAREKRARLAKRLQALGSMVEAFSGGVDSSFLLALAHEVVGNRVLGVTAASAIRPRRETQAACDFTRSLGIRHRVLDSLEMELPEFLSNGPDRCYHCKRHLAERLFEIARGEGISCVVHGENADDLRDYRPGLRAAEECGMIAPLADAGLTKEEIRFLSREMGLPGWDAPARPCLATRIPYGMPITVEGLRMVEEAEGFLRARGLGEVRVRHHGPVARIEIGAPHLGRLLDEPLRSDCVSKLRSLGFAHVALDLEGYRMGKMNREIPEDR